VRRNFVTGVLPASAFTRFLKETFRKAEHGARWSDPAPNVYDAEPIPEAARAEIDRLLSSGDLFRYTAPSDAPVALLEPNSPP
jgi:hypothetical protein